jgi:threonine aldolase
MHVNLMSDTVTRPNKGMLEYMMQAEVGDDVFGEDPTVKKLESKMAEMFDHESALFCPSGTMANQIAIKCHTKPLDEMLCEINSHVYQYESAGFAFNSGISVQLIHGNHGIMDASQVEDHIRPLYDWLPITRLVVLENTVNRAGGCYYTYEQMSEISKVCENNTLKFHLDGARIFNAFAESGDKPTQIGPLFDSISVCLSKGLGAPIGSVLIGSSKFINESRRIRKVMGGGMRQAGYLAAAGLYALENNIDRLKTDHKHASILAETLQVLGFVENIRPVHTNIVIFDLNKLYFNATTFIEKLKSEGIRVSGFGPYTIRMVTHLDVNEQMIDFTCGILHKINMNKP